MTPSLARLREEWTRKTETDPLNIESIDEKGSSSNFDPSGRGKYLELMKAIGLVGTSQAKKTLEMLRDNFGNDPSKIGGYWCYNCEYFSEKPSTVTGFFCKQFLFPDYPYECCNGWNERNED